jgi:isopenicillin-N epimerase
LIVDHVTSATARLLPVATIAVAARAAGVAVAVDAAHAPGMVPVDVGSLDVDFWTGNLHKWAFAPRGTAVLAVAERWRERIQPLAVSWSQRDGFPMRVEWQATQDYTPWLAAPVGLFVLRSLGLDTVRAHNADLAAYGQQVVGAALGVAPDDMPHPGASVAMRLLPLPDGLATTWPEAHALRQLIAETLAAEVNVMSWAGRGWLRLCGQVYNHADDYDRLAEKLPGLLATLS